MPLDKAAHFFTYGILGLLAMRGWLRSGRPQKPLFVILAAALVAAADELHQTGVPGRSAELADWFADLLGIAVATVATLRFARKSTNVV